MRDVNAALYEFWSGFGIPAYRAGRVPSGAEYPYITFEVVSGGFWSKTTLAATTWHKAPGATVAAAGILDAIAREIPDSGLILPMDGRGQLVIYRNRSDFQSYVPDGEDQDVIGGRTRYTVQFYTV